MGSLLGTPNLTPYPRPSALKSASSPEAQANAELLESEKGRLLGVHQALLSKDRAHVVPGKVICMWSGLGELSGVGCGRRSSGCLIHLAVVNHFKTATPSQNPRESIMHPSFASNFSPA